jgi:hypothetical protein
MPEAIVGIYGMSGNADFDRRKAEKQARYRSMGIKVVEWETRGPLPDLAPELRAPRWALSH